MAEGDRSQAGKFQASTIQAGIFVLPPPTEISAVSTIDLTSTSTLSRDTSYSSIVEIQYASDGIFYQDVSFNSSTNIDFNSPSFLSLDQSLTPRQGFTEESRASLHQSSGMQAGYYEAVNPATSIEIESSPRLSLTSILSGESEVQLSSEGIVGVDVYIDSDTQEIEFSSQGVVGVDKDVFGESQLELIASGDLEIVVIFTNESCLIGVKNTESDLVGVSDIENTLIGVIKKCDLV